MRGSGVVRKGGVMKRGAVGRAAALPVLLLLLLCALIAPLAAALPPLPTEFYGNITVRGSPAPAGGVVQARWPGGACASFTVITPGAFGLLTCAGDDPGTGAVEGPSPGTEVSFLYNNQPAVVVEGTNRTADGSFAYVRLSAPAPACGDGYCDPLFETYLSCPRDCRLPGPANATNSTNTTGGGSGAEDGGASGGGAGDGSGGAGGGGGGGGGGAVGPTPYIVSALGTIAGSTAPFGCTEEWSCQEWTRCTIEGLQERSCEDLNSCGTTRDRPPLVQECSYAPVCYDNLQNGDETGLDCGGSLCAPCAGCANGVKDPGEERVDCGGWCRPCDSCFNGVQDHGETGRDCGGPCGSCNERVRPVLEFPALVCEKPANPLRNDARWFLLLVAVLAGARVALYSRELRKTGGDQLLDEFKRAAAMADLRRERVLFILVTVAVATISYLYYYLFLLCSAGYRYLWLFLLVLLVAPLAVYGLLRLLTYSDARHLALLRAQTKTHEEHLNELLVFENAQLVQIEQDLAARIEEVARDRALQERLAAFPDLRQIYKDIVLLYDEYRRNKTPTGIEKDLCEKVYAIETNASFRELAAGYPDIAVIHQKLALLYRHYEEKQKLYDELEQLREQNRQKAMDAPAEKDAEGPGEKTPE